MSAELKVNKQWFVVYTKSRQEKKTAEKLIEAGFEAYCPVRKVTRQWSDRKKMVEVPLFTSYCFVRCHEHQRSEVVKASGVVCFVFWCGKPAIVQDKEIEEIKRWLNEYNNDLLTIESFSVSEQILIQSGAFINHKATVIQEKGKQLILEIENLGFRLVTTKEATLVKKTV